MSIECAKNCYVFSTITSFKTFFNRKTKFCLEDSFCFSSHSSTSTFALLNFYLFSESYDLHSVLVKCKINPTSWLNIIII